jgi:hypothetical protein
MIDHILEFKYINNLSDILSLCNDNNFKELLNKIKNKKIKTNSRLVHNSNEISSLEQFIFNLDNYICFLKSNLNINQFEIRYITKLTIFNKYNNVLYSDIYYYDDIDFYIANFKKMFMYNYLKNYNILKNYINIKKLSFDELIIKLNKIKNKAHYYFENANDNLPYYMTIIDYLENTSYM